MTNSSNNKPTRTRGRLLWKPDNTADQSDVTVPIYLAYCGIVAALRHHVAAKTSSLAVLETTTPDAIDSYVHAGRLFLRQLLNRRGYSDPFVRAIRQRKSDKPSELDVYRRAAEDGRGILLCTSLCDVDEELRLFADVVVTIPQPTANQISATFKRYGHVLTTLEQQMIASESWTRLVYAFPPDRPVLAGLRRLRETASRPPVRKVVPVATGPTLENLSGLGPAREWGLELSRDLADFKAGLISWDDVDTGALISGAPGTGKTLFAEALARTCALPIVAASAAQWQAAGYLNDLLKAMRESFREAQSKGTALLFIDELDAMGSRAVNDSQNADYKRQVINGLLELLDGFERRTGVVVVGATNHPGDIDPAILRPGRLDRHFEIPLPDSTTRQQIFQFHAGFAVPEDYEDQFARSTAGMAGAGLKQLVRDGRRIARRSGKPFGFEQVLEAAKPLIDLPAELMRVAAFHEAGHAIVGLELGMELKGISVADKILAEGVNTLGGALFTRQAFPMKTKSFYLNLITMYLGGLAAETLIFGEFTESGASDPNSDLGVATALATKVEASFGMGSTLAIDVVLDHELGRLRTTDNRVRAAVSEILARQFTRAREILDLRKKALGKIADTLLTARSMSAAEVGEVLLRHPGSHARPLGVDTSEPDYPVQVARRAIHGVHEDEVRREMDAALRRWRML
ncbi:AAA family ATPase [Neorhizobium sp. JUb45]|uniref:AAA family ATPase n=1 Tax=Neorhizobium sp. JUb45 TaxID=2485113 RepID=UPI001052AA1F|nr:AAA family ATPase [Neorhizobium sp. JUb45]